MTRLPGIIAVFFCAVLAGCASAPKENFYVLSAGAPLERGHGVASLPNTRIVVGPVSITEIVDRPQIVTRVAPNQVAILEQERWAESLKNQITRVVGENLAMLLGTKQVSTYTCRVAPSRPTIESLWKYSDLNLCKGAITNGHCAEWRLHGDTIHSA